MDAVRAERTHRRSLSSGLQDAGSASGGGRRTPTAASTTPLLRGSSGGGGGRATSASPASGAGATSAVKKQPAWVAVRIRPLLEAELLAREATAWRPSSADGLQFTDPQRPAAAQQRQQAALTYSRVFSEVTTSEAVYGDAARGLLAAALRGFNATLLAYGPTGSGKTFTMQGVMACAAQDLFRLVAAEPGRECIVRLSALEVYNEVVRDLLQERCPSVKLVDDPLRGPTADGATEACVASQEQLQQLLADIAARRQTRATRMNDNSSRSHAVVRLYIESRQRRTAAVTAVNTSVINFVDLAGSEWAAQADAGGDAAEKLRHKEAGHINKSLLTLNTIVRGLADNQRHLPYRDSKLTRLLQPHLAGNSHMAVITTISPSAGAVEATRAALQFATAASRVMMRPQSNQVPGSKAVIKAVAAEIQQLKSKLTQLEDGQLVARQRESQAAATVQERGALRSRLQQLQEQILHSPGAVPAHKMRASLDSREPLWRNRVAIAKELRASSAGILTLRAGSDAAAPRDSSNDKQQPSAAAMGRSGSNSSGLGGAVGQPPLLRPATGLDPCGSPLLAGVSEVRRSMRLLNCYLPRSAEDGGDGGRNTTDSSRQLPHAQQQQQQSSLLPQRQAGFQSILQQAALKQQMAGPKQQQQQQQQQAPSSIPLHQRRQLAKQQQQQQQVSMLNPSRQPPQQQTEEVMRALQMQKLQEPCGPEAEAAMAGLEVEVRCYKHVQEYTLAELSAALAHLESQAAAGQGTGSWSQEHLDALRSEVKRKRAAEELTQLAGRALDALTRKISSYTSSADNSPFGEGGRRAQQGHSSAGGASSGCGSLIEAALAGAAATAAAAAAGMPASVPSSGRPSSTGGGLDSMPSCRRLSSPTEAFSHDGEQSSWSEAAPCLLSGQTTPLVTVASAGSRGAGSSSSKGGAAAAAAPAPAPAGAARPSSAGSAAVTAGRSAAAAMGRGSDMHSDVGVSAEPSTSSAAAATSSSTTSRRQSGAGAAVAYDSATAGLLSPVSSASAALSAHEQLLRMQEAWRESVEKDVMCLREVLAQHKEQAERLEMQKTLLLSQVLKLEFTLEEKEALVAALQAQNTTLQQQLAHALRERDAARAAAASAAVGGGAAAASAAAAAATAPPSAAGSDAASSSVGTAAAGALNISLPPLNTALGAGMAFFDACSDDGWASTPTVDSLLPKIVALWDELYVPLAYRSRFFLCFRAKEVFYYEVEARRLEWKRSQMLQGTLDEDAPQHAFGRRSFGCGDGVSTPTAAGGMRGPAAGGLTPRPLSAAAAAGLTASSSSLGAMRRRSKELDRAARALDWERKSLAAGLKWNLTEAEREELYRAWGVDADTKERKLQLVFKLWSKDVLQQPDGMQRSSELVVQLCGMDASEHMMELVFGSHLREYASARAPLGRSSSNGLSMALTNVVRRLAPPLSRAGAIGGSPLRMSMTSANGGGGGFGSAAYAGGGGGGGGFAAGPSRAGGSFTSKISSGFMTLLSSKERTPGLTSRYVAGIAAGSVGPGSVGPASREDSFSSLASSVMPAGGRRH